MNNGRFVQHSVSLNEQLIMLHKEGVYYTHVPGEAFLILKGTVRVFLVPWNQAERCEYRVLLGEHEQGTSNLIPSFSHTDTQSDNWCFAFVSNAEETVIERCYCPDHELEKYLAAVTGRSQTKMRIEDAIISLYTDADSGIASPCMDLQLGERYYTSDSDDSWYVEKGSANVYVVPFSVDGKPGKLEFLRTADDSDGSIIPGYFKQSESLIYRLCISPEKDVISLRKTKCTQTGSERFLEGTKAQYYTKEGFESALIQFYKKNNELAQLVKEAERKAIEEEMRREQKNAIHDGLGDEKIAPVSKSSSALYHAMHYICRKGKIELRAEADLNRVYANKSMLPIDIARASNFICRDVVLDDNWWHNDCGLLLCYKDSKPIACVPSSSGRYSYYDPETGKEGKLTDSLARDLGPKAYSIRRSLPLTSIGKKQMFAFVKKSIVMRDIYYLVLIGVLCIAVSMLLPYLNQKIYDDYIPSGEVGMLIQICLVIGTFMLGNTFFTLVKKLFEFRIATKAGYELQDAVYHRIFQMKESFLRHFESGDLSQRVQSFGNLANRLVKKMVVTGISAVFALLYIFQMVHYAKRLTLAAMIMLGIYAAAIYLIASFAARYEKTKTESANEAMAKLHQYLDGIQKIRMAGVENRAALDYLKSTAITQRASVLSNRVSSLSDALRDAGVTLFTMILFYMIVSEKLELSTGNFIAFNTAFGSLCAATMELVNDYIEYIYMKPGIALAGAILADAPEIDENDVSSKVDELTGEISLESVSFSYSESGGTVLHDINIHVLPGEYVGIVGPSGCGKSTLFKLLLGFETPKAGCVKYGGSDLNSMNVHSLRKQLGVVLQNGSLIAGSIYDNVTITMDSPTRKAAEEAIEKVGLKGDIDNMPMHMDTVINESAGTISGGQKQRILIARAIAGNPKILLFDEATSALDNVTQAKVCDSLDRMNITRIVIAHRLSTIEHCDRILVMDRGSIIQQGTFDKLISEDGLFQRMAARQMSGYEEE